MKKRNKRKYRWKWIGGLAGCTGLLLLAAYVPAGELGGFDVEIGTGDGNIPENWNEPDSFIPQSEEIPQESHPETIPEAIPESIPETVPESIPETVPESIPEAVPESIPEAVPEFMPESFQEEQISSEGKLPDSLPDKPIETPAPSKPVQTVPSPSESPSAIESPVFIPDPVTLEFKHLEKPEEPEKPWIQVCCDGGIGILSVRQNGQECLWKWENDRIVWENSHVEEKNRVEVLAVTEDCRLVRMTPWEYCIKSKRHT